MLMVALLVVGWIWSCGLIFLMVADCLGSKISVVRRW